MRTLLASLFLLVAACGGERDIAPPSGLDGGARPDSGSDAGTEEPTGPPTLTDEGVFELPGCTKCERVFVRPSICEYMCVGCSLGCSYECGRAHLAIECEDH